MSDSPTIKKPHCSQEGTNLSLKVKAAGIESVYATEEGTLGGHAVPFPRGDLYIGSMAPHMALVGSSGAGKTILQKGFMKAILPARLEDGGLRYRSMIYDPKRELYPFLRAIGIPEEQIIVTHPFDLRSPAWDLAADFTETAQIIELSEMLIPKAEHPRGGGGDFFDKTGRIIVQDVIHGLIQAAPGAWDLRDVIEAVLTPHYTRQILDKTERGRRSWAAYFDRKVGSDTRLADNIRASLHTALSPFETLATVWHHSKEKFSLARWLTGTGILLMGADPEREGTLQQLNQLLFHRASQLLLARNEENPLDLTWFFLDELREAGKLNGLRQILTQGRSKGARVIVGFQDIDGLRELYGEKTAEEIVGLCANRFFLHQDNPNTREWISRFFADEEAIIHKYSETHGTTDGKSSSSTSNSYEVGQVRNVLPVELQDLPLASNKNGVFGFYSTPPRGLRYRDGRPKAERGDFRLQPEAVAKINQIGGGTDKERFNPRPPEQQKFVYWDAHDIRKFDVHAPLPEDPLGSV